MGRHLVEGSRLSEQGVHPLGSPALEIVPTEWSVLEHLDYGGAPLVDSFGGQHVFYDRVALGVEGAKDGLDCGFAPWALDCLGDRVRNRGHGQRHPPVGNNLTLNLPKGNVKWNR